MPIFNCNFSPSYNVSLVSAGWWMVCWWLDGTMETESQQPGWRGNKTVVSTPSYMSCVPRDPYVPKSHSFG